MYGRRATPPDPDNFDDADLLRGIGTTLRKISLDLEEKRSQTKTIYGDDAIIEALGCIDDAVAALSRAADLAERNAQEDAENKIADYWRDFYFD